MKTQTIINCLFAVVIIALAVILVTPRDATFNTITCKGWNVVDGDGKQRITAFTNPEGDAGVQWRDKDGKGRIGASTFADGDASMQWIGKDGKVRIGASTDAKGNAIVVLGDNDGKSRIGAATFSDGTVGLPTKDMNPPKEP